MVERTLSFEENFKNCIRLRKVISVELEKIVVGNGIPCKQEAKADGFFLSIEEKEIFDAICQVNENLSKSYLQVKKDITDTKRDSWIGCAHEIREVLCTMLEILAPDDEVFAAPWYKKEQKNDPDVTQKQRVKLIFEKKKYSSSRNKVLQSLTRLDETVEELIRAIYGRASDAAHARGKDTDRNEVIRIVRYFDTFCLDLFSID